MSKINWYKMKPKNLYNSKINIKKVVLNKIVKIA